MICFYSGYASPMMCLRQGDMLCDLITIRMTLSACNVYTCDVVCRFHVLLSLRNDMLGTGPPTGHRQPVPTDPVGDRRREMGGSLCGFLVCSSLLTKRRSLTHCLTLFCHFDAFLPPFLCRFSHRTLSTNLSDISAPIS